MIPKLLTSEHLPGLGSEHEVGLVNVGVCAVNATIAVTSAAAADYVATAPNTGVGGATGPVVHSLGVSPTAVIPMQIGLKTGAAASVSYQYLTADNSAVYIYALYSGTAGILGVGTRLVMIR